MRNDAQVGGKCTDISACLIHTLRSKICTSIAGCCIDVVQHSPLLLYSPVGSALSEVACQRRLLRRIHRQAVTMLHLHVRADVRAHVARQRGHPRHRICATNPPARAPSPLPEQDTPPWSPGKVNGRRCRNQSLTCSMWYALRTLDVVQTRDDMSVAEEAQRAYDSSVMATICGRVR